MAVLEDVSEDVLEDIRGYIRGCGMYQWMYQWMSCHNVISLWPDLQVLFQASDVGLVSSDELCVALQTS